MVAIAGLALGAPGIYPHPDVPVRALAGVRMDICAFLGVAPRGPARVPVVDESWRDDRPCVEPERPRRRTVAVVVESFDEYRQLYGGFEGPGLLPYAVASFFEQGGRRAYVARVVHEYANRALDSGGVASGLVLGAETSAGSLGLRARSEGTWGNRLVATLGYSVRPLSFVRSSVIGFVVATDIDLPAGSLLRLTLPSNQCVLRFVEGVNEIARTDAPGVRKEARFNQSTEAVPQAAEIVYGTLAVDDGNGRSERHERVGLSSQHPRWMARVLCYESQLVFPEPTWIASDIYPTGPDLSAATPSMPQFTGGEDRYADITPEDFFDASWNWGDDEPGGGIYALTQLADLSLVVTPDLYSPGPLVPTERIVEMNPSAGPRFEPCLDMGLALEQAAPVADLDGLRLDPRLPEDLQKITALQGRLVELADRMRSFVALLDVPPSLSQRQILAWCGAFSSSYAAAYHPWLRISRRDDKRDALIRVPPSAVGAGIIAKQELAFGVPQGPANVVAAEVVDVETLVSSASHDELHPAGVNVFLRERDGVRLTAARTMSRDPAYGQLNVRRLMTMISRALERETQWIVFEPNSSALRAELRHLIVAYLRGLFRAGAFRGATEEEAFFVRCDEVLNPVRVIDAGQLIAEIGVAPAEPIEFIVLRLARDGDGTLTVQE